MSAAEQARKLLLQAGIDALEGLLEPRAGLLVDPAHGLLEGIQRRGEVRVLAVEVLLALGLLLQLIDRGEIHLAELLQVDAHLRERLLPLRHARLFREPRVNLRKLEARLGKLLGEALPPDPGFLGGHAGRFHRLAGLIDELLRAQALLIQRPQLRIGVFQLPSGHRQLGLNIQTPGERIVQARFELQNRLIRTRQLLFQLLATAHQLRALLRHAIQTDSHRAFGRAPRLEADQQIAPRQLCALCAGSRGGHAFAPLLTLAFQIVPARIQFTQQHQAPVQFGPSFFERLFSDAALL